MTAYSFPISGAAMFTIQGSELYLDPAKYDAADPDVVTAHNALNAAERQPRGRGVSYLVTVDRGGAEVIAEFCRDVGAGFAMESDPETRADGRALLVVAQRIAQALK